MEITFGDYAEFNANDTRYVAFKSIDGETEEWAVYRVSTFGLEYVGSAYSINILASRLAAGDALTDDIPGWDRAV